MKNIKILILGLLIMMSVNPITFASTLGDTGALNQPYGLAIDNTNTIYIVDTFNNEIKVLRNNQWETFAGGNDGVGSDALPVVGYVDGPLLQARFNRPRGIAISETGQIYVADTGNHVIRVIEEGKVKTLAGSSDQGYKDGAGNIAAFNTPSGMAIDSKGILYVADTLNNVIRTIDETGHVKTYGLNPSNGIEQLNEPTDIYIDSDDNLYIVDSGNQQIKRVVNHEVTLLAGLPVISKDEYGYAPSGDQDGFSKSSGFNFPKAITMDYHGNLYVADTWNNKVRVIKKDGRVATFLGSEADLDNPIEVYAKGKTLYVVDRWDQTLKAFDINPVDKALELSGAFFGENANLITGNDYISVWYEGAEIALDAPVLVDETLYIPLKVMANTFGYSVKWQASPAMVTLQKGNHMIELTQTTGLKLVDGRSYISAYDFETLLNHPVDYSKTFKIITIQ